MPKGCKNNVSARLLAGFVLVAFNESFGLRELLAGAAGLAELSMPGSAAASPSTAAGSAVIAAVVASGATGACPDFAGSSVTASSSGAAWCTRAGSNPVSVVPMGAAVVALRNKGVCGATTIAAAGGLALGPGAEGAGATSVTAGRAGIFAAPDAAGACALLGVR